MREREHTLRVLGTRAMAFSKYGVLWFVRRRSRRICVIIRVHGGHEGDEAHVHDVDGLKNHCFLFVTRIRQLYQEI